MSRAMEDYLKTIYLLQHQYKQVETSVLAQRLNVANSTATVMMQRLAKKGLVNYQPYTGVTLTCKGQKQALDVIRRHRLLECWLVTKLGLPWEMAHAEADRLEHAFSDALIDRLDACLGYPTTSPYGSPIPNHLGQVVRASATRLSELPLGQTALVSEVTDYQAELLAYFAQMKLYPGVVVRVSAIEPFGGSLKVEVDGVERGIGRDAAEQVFIAIPLESKKNLFIKIIHPEEEYHIQENKIIEQVANQPSLLQENRSC